MPYYCSMGKIQIHYNKSVSNLLKQYITVKSSVLYLYIILRDKLIQMIMFCQWYSTDVDWWDRAKLYDEFALIYTGAFTKTVNQLY